MKIVAIYLDDHYLFVNPQTINFGGKYHYSFENKSNVSRKLNNIYIEQFYDSEIIDSISAIVGKNGAGKTTLLKTVIENINYGKRYDRQSFMYTAIFEDDESNAFITSDSYTSEKGYSLDFPCEHLNLDTETIYYSPFLDYVQEIEGIDLSLDTIIEKDLDSIDKIYQANSEVVPLRRLKMKNALRQLEFQNSKYGKDLKEFFDFPEFSKSRFTFTRHKIDINLENDTINFWNTPRDFTGSLQSVYKKIRNEADEINKNRPSGYSLVQLQKDLLKNYILMDILCLFIKQMEKSNDFLDEGKIAPDFVEFEKQLQNMNAYQGLISFLKSHSLGISKSDKRIKMLPENETINLIEKLYGLIDNAEAKDDKDTRFFNWNEKSIYLDSEETETLIKLNNDFLIELDKYYGGIKDDSGKRIFSRTIRIEGILNFEPSERSLSSGENALLNFYSRIYDHFKMNNIEINIKTDSPYYHIFLDEADLGFHPKWKKKFVGSVLTFLSNFFKDLKAKVQIIFTTHDPLTLSDILNYNIIYIDEENGTRYIQDTFEKPKRSFGANITDLLADSFFVGNGLIGDFAKGKIDDCITWLRNLDDKTKDNYYKSLIKNVDEPIIQKKLSEMYDEKMKTKISRELLENQISYLQEQLKKYKE